jgi:DHA2 family multidrug resistance protein
VERLDPNAPVTSQALSTLHSGGLGSDQGYAVLNRLVDSQAFMLSADDIFYVSGFIFLVLIGLVWLAKPARADAGGGGGAAASAAH